MSLLVSVNQLNPMKAIINYRNIYFTHNDDYKL